VEKLKFRCVVDEKTGCWNWTKGIANNGYGKTTITGRKHISAHRAMYSAAVGPIPKGMCVLHRCDNRACCNPKHLRLGTYGDNNREAYEKGRNPNTPFSPKQTPSEVREIRRLYATGNFSYASLAVEIKKPLTMITSALRKWKNLHLYET
jgi:hypothetical protein